MGYLLDTCAVIDLVRGNQSTVNQVKSKSPAEVYISSITAFELGYGLVQNPDVKSHSKEVVRSFLSEVNILSFSTEEADMAAQLRYSLKIAGTPIGAYDILIAATAKVSDYVLVTSKIKEFQRIPDLTIENWRD